MSYTNVLTPLRLYVNWRGYGMEDVSRQNKIWRIYAIEMVRNPRRARHLHITCHGAAIERTCHAAKHGGSLPPSAQTHEVPPGSQRRILLRHRGTDWNNRLL